MWSVLAACAVLIATTSSLSLQLPADIAITGGKAVDHICGACCQAGAYCGAAAEDFRIQDVRGREVTVSKGSSLTCVLRDRGAFGAVDGGLCVPSNLPTDFVLADMCRLHDKTLPASHTLTQVVYQAGLTAQDRCGACYDGKHFCGANLVCRRTATTSPDTSVSAPAICVPEGAGDYACEQRLGTAETLQYESCDSPTPAAEAFERQHSLPFRRLQAVSDSLPEAATANSGSARSLLTTAGASVLSKAGSMSVSDGKGTAPAPTASTKSSKAPAKAPSKGPSAAPSKAPVPAPAKAPAKAPVPAPAPAMAFAPASGGGNVHKCSKSIHCPLPQYNQCKKGKCVKKPNYCDKNTLCKAGYQCNKHWCVKKKQSAKHGAAKHGSAKQG